MPVSPSTCPITRPGGAARSSSSAGTSSTDEDFLALVILLGPFAYVDEFGAASHARDEVSSLVRERDDYGVVRVAVHQRFGSVANIWNRVPSTIARSPIHPRTV